LGKKGFETFSAYGLSIDYPAVCRIEFNPKSRREAGDVVFHFPDREKVFLSWGKLEDAQRNFPTVEDQAEHSLKAVGKNAEVKTFDRVSHDSLKINSHMAVYNRVRIEQVASSFSLRKRTIEREALSLHLRCESQSRYYVIYTLLSTNAPEDFEDVFLEIIHTFKCH
jgi:hypothetical protein